MSNGGLLKDAWDGIVRLKGRQWAEEWRNENGVPVEGMPPPQRGVPPSNTELPSVNPLQAPVYEGQPLDAARPQGTSMVDETEDTEVPAGALDFATMTPETFSTGLNKVLARASGLAPVMSEKDYEAAKQKIMERRFGPSRAEQLFALSAALAKPTYAGNRFGQILGNVAPALADTERMRREADTARESALEALKQQYMTGTNAAERQKIEALLSVYKTAAPVVAAKMKPKPSFKSVVIENGISYDPVSGAKIVQPSEAAWAALRANPTRENYNNFIRTFGPRFEEDAMRAIGMSGDM